MNDIDKAIQSQLKNIETRSGKSLAELKAIVHTSGLKKHGEIRDMLKRDLGLGHGDANTLTHYALDSIGPAAVESPAAADPLVDEFYAGPKAPLRPIHDRIMAAIHAFGPFEIAPKKTYLSLRRKKQFAMVRPATKDSIEIGLNAKDLPVHARLKLQPPGSMCHATTRITSTAEVDAALVGWLRQAYDAAG